MAPGAAELEYEINPKIAAEVEAELAEMDSAEDAQTTAAAEVDPTAPKRSKSTFDLGAAAVAAVQTKAATKPEPGGGGCAKTSGGSGAEAGAEALGSGNAQPATGKEDFGSLCEALCGRPGPVVHPF